MKRSRFPLIITWALLAFFYLPIFVLVLYSFNSSRFGGSWTGWSLHWYRQLYRRAGDLACPDQQPCDRLFAQRSSPSYLGPRPLLPCTAFHRVCRNSITR